MHVLAMEISLHLPYVRSLKGKRAVRQSLVAKLVKYFSLSVRETDLQEISQKLVLAAAFVCLTPGEGEEYAQQIEDFLYRFSLEEACEVQSLVWDILAVFNA